MHQLTILEPIEYLVIGHISRDLTINGPLMGGTAAYATLTAKAMGLKVGVITSWGNDIPLGPMDGIAIINQTTKSSTTFENLYSENGRKQIIHHPAKTLDISLIPRSWLNAPIVHLGPIANEIDLGLTEAFPNSFVGVTPQGWMRSWDEKGSISQVEWSNYSQVLPRCQAAIVSREDTSGDETKIEEMASSCPVFVVTEGYLGCRVYWHGDVRRFNAPEVEETDPTGAGDIFAAAFFVQYNKTGNPWEAARFANQLAAHSVTRTGINSIPTKNEIMKAISEVL
jgi:sugar/nucleoside kinase (ribokinase family)